jgi:hypothetical protein
MENPEIFPCCLKCKERHLVIESNLDNIPKRWDEHISNISCLVRKIYKCCGYFNEMGKYLYEIVDTMQYNKDQSKKPFQYMDVRMNLVKVRVLLDDYKTQLQAGINDHNILIKAVIKFGYFTDYKKKYKKRILNKIHIRSLKLQIENPQKYDRLDDLLDYQALEKEKDCYKQKAELLQEALDASFSEGTVREIVNSTVQKVFTENLQLKQRIQKLEADHVKVQSLLKTV